MTIELDLVAPSPPASKSSPTLPSVTMLPERSVRVPTAKRRRPGQSGRDREPLRVGILAPPWVAVPPPAYGGTESVLDRLARGLHRAGHEVRLWTTQDSTCPVPLDGVFAEAQTDAMGTSSVELQHVISGYDWFQEQGCHVVHDHTLVGPFLAPMTMPVITTNHGPFDQPELASIYRRMQERVPIISISRQHAVGAARVGVEVAHVIHHGIDVAEVAEGDGAGDEFGPYLLFLGRMNPTKGVVEAIEIAKATGSRLLIAAKMREPAEIAFFEREVAPRLGDGVEFIGEIGGRRKEQLLGGAAALLNPIQWPEPFGLVMIEALAAGTPVISTGQGAAPELVVHGRTGYLADDRPSLELAVRSIDRIDRRECRADVASRFSTERMVARHADAYTSAVHVAQRLQLAPNASWSARE